MVISFFPLSKAFVASRSTQLVMPCMSTRSGLFLPSTRASRCVSIVCMQHSRMQALKCVTKSVSKFIIAPSGVCSVTWSSIMLNLMFSASHASHSPLAGPVNPVFKVRLRCYRKSPLTRSARTLDLRMTLRASWKLLYKLANCWSMRVGSLITAMTISMHLIRLVLPQ